MLTAVRLQGFKSFADATLPLGPLTLLIGANAAGKSNAVEALRLLSAVARGRLLDPEFDASFGREMRGGLGTSSGQAPTTCSSP